MLRATWSRVNCAFLVTFGSALCGIGPDSRSFFPTKESLDRELASLGLVRRRDGTIVVAADAKEVRIAVVVGGGAS